MSKAILVIDMPENCYDCQLRNFDCCNITGENAEVTYKPLWCPLKELPNRMICFGENDYAEGYNDCLDEILEVQHGRSN